MIPADQYHPNYWSYECIVQEPEGDYYKYFVIMQPFHSLFFYLTLDCANPRCGRRWTGFYRRLNGVKAKKYPEIHHFFNMGGEDHIEECKSSFKLNKSAVVKLPPKVTFPTHA